MKGAAFIFIIVQLYSCSAEKADIYQWRGENRAGSYDETGLLKEWPTDGPAELWSSEGLGNGFGSPVVTENEIFITGEEDSLCWLWSLNPDGRPNWKKAVGPEWAKHYPGSRSAPTVADDLVYAGTGMGIIACLHRKTGELIWSRDYLADFNGELPLHGYSEAPVVVDNLLICTPGGKDNNVVALNRFNGKTIWSCRGMQERMAYNPGNIIKLPSRKIYVTFTAYHLMGIDVETGELLWTHPQDNTSLENREPGIGDTHSNNILYDNGFIYYAAGDGNGGVKLRLSDNGTEIIELWRISDLDSYMSGFVKAGDYLYGCGTRKKQLRSFHADSGTASDSLHLGTGAIIAADNMLYYYNWSGELMLLSYSEGKMKKISAFKVRKGSREHFSHPVIRKGILYQRHGDALMAYQISQGNEIHEKT